MKNEIICVNIKKRFRYRESVQGQQASFALELEASKDNGTSVVIKKGIQSQGHPETALKIHVQ